MDFCSFNHVHQRPIGPIFIWLHWPNSRCITPCDSILSLLFMGFETNHCSIQNSFKAVTNVSTKSWLRAYQYMSLANISSLWDQYRHQQIQKIIYI